MPASKVSRPLGALALIAVLAFGVSALAPAEVSAVQCFCPPANTLTAHGWTDGHPSCAAARAACESDARGNAQANCNVVFGSSVCSWGSITFNPPSCVYEGPGDWMVDCNQKYQCERCLDF